jgi:hypothetical protein
MPDRVCCDHQHRRVSKDFVVTVHADGSTEAEFRPTWFCLVCWYSPGSMGVTDLPESGGQIVPTPDYGDALADGADNA